MQFDIHILEVSLSSPHGNEFGHGIVESVAAGECLEIVFEDGTVRRWRNASQAANFLREFGWNSHVPAQEI